MIQQIIGLNIGHNSSAVLFANNKEILRLEEEKLSQIKGFFGFPSESMQNILNLINPKMDLEVIVGHTNIFEIFPTHRLLMKFCKINKKIEYFYFLLDLYKFIFPKTTLLRKTVQIHFEQNLKSKYPLIKKIAYVDHHESHALSAVFDSSFENCLVLTRDGKGDFFSGKDYIYNNGSLTLIGNYGFLRSYGLVYAAATKALGFKMLRHEGKLTGLAAFGNPKLLSEKISLRYNDKIKNDVVIKHDQKVNFKNFIKSRFSDKLINQYSHLLNDWIFYFKTLVEDGFADKDIAAGVQAFLEASILMEINKLKLNYAIPKSIALAGGIFANVKLNQKIWELEYFDRMFVQPAMDDAGTALGAAASKLKMRISQPTLINSVYLGLLRSDYNLKNLPQKFKVRELDDQDIGPLIYKELSVGKIIGTYQGRTEWGPRALGNRSILASAFDKEIPNELNKRLRRNDFMPFAPIIRDIDATKIFNKYSSGLTATKFMTVTLTVRDEFKNIIPSVIHVDGTARPQILFEIENRSIYRILNSIADNHGVGVVLNTSFNLHEFPILDNFQTALNNLEIGAVDMLVYNGNVLISLK